MLSKREDTTAWFNALPLKRRREVLEVLRLARLGLLRIPDQNTVEEVARHLAADAGMKWSIAGGRPEFR